MTIIWKDIPNYEGYYKISNTGIIKSCDRIVKNGKNTFRNQSENIKTIQINKLRNGYCEICLYKDGIAKRHKVHRLVAIAFIPNTANKPEINHIDGNKLNNRVDNLEWVTSYENKQHGWKNKLYTGNHLKRKILCINNNTIFNSIAECSRQLNIDRRSIFRLLKGEKKHIKGLTFSYINE